MAELFQLKVLCENLVRIGWAFQELVSTDKKKKKIEFSGGRNPLLGGGYIWPVVPIFKLRWAIPVKSHVWKFGLDCLKSEACKILGGGGEGLQKPHLLEGGHMWPVMPNFVHGQAISVKSLVWKFGSDRLSLSRVIVFTDKKE